MTQVVMFSEIVEPNGKTIRQNNLEKTHSIPLDSLVEIRDDDEEGNSDGVRLYVAEHSRDCDGTPLYTLHYKKGERPVGRECPNFTFFNMAFVTGMPESVLSVVK